MDKVRVIERSLRCFVAGCLAMIPLLGIIPAVVAICLHHAVRNEVGHSWNPARAYLVWGCVFAWVGLSITLVALGTRFRQQLF
jgi:hypothetical protein